MILDDQYTVTTDAFQWVLTKTVINAESGKPSTKRTYFPSLKLALKYYLDESIKNDTAEEILAAIIRVENKIDAL